MRRFNTKPGRSKTFICTALTIFALIALSKPAAAQLTLRQAVSVQTPDGFCNNDNFPTTICTIKPPSMTLNFSPTLSNSALLVAGLEGMAGCKDNLGQSWFGSQTWQTRPGVSGNHFFVPPSGANQTGLTSIVCDVTTSFTDMLATYGHGSVGGEGEQVIQFFEVAASDPGTKTLSLVLPATVFFGVLNTVPQPPFVAVPSTNGAVLVGVTTDEYYEHIPGAVVGGIGATDAGPLQGWSNCTGVCKPYVSFMETTWGVDDGSGTPIGRYCPSDTQFGFSQGCAAEFIVRFFTQPSIQSQLVISAPSLAPGGTAQVQVSVNPVSQSDVPFQLMSSAPSNIPNSSGTIPSGGTATLNLTVTRQPGVESVVLTATSTGYVQTSATVLMGDPPTASAPESPIQAPQANDTTFVTGAGSGLGLRTICTYRSGGPLVFNIDVTRYVGAISADGTLQNAAALVSAGLLSATATLKMAAFDVDYFAAVPAPYQPERDRVSFNGQPLGFLTQNNGGFLNGVNNGWKVNSFDVPIQLLHFPSRGTSGLSPTPAHNEIRIDIDTANTADVWCTSIDWGALTIKAISPVILVHGNNSDGGFFDRQGFAGELKRENIPYDNSISMDTDSVHAHGTILDGKIPSIVKSFGVDSVHLVVHSKGGLDSREYLSVYQPNHDKDFKILSLSSLSSPHNGSAGADVLQDRADEAKRAAKIEFVGFPFFSDVIVEKIGTDAGTPDLTTGAALTFNAANIPKLPKSVVFNTTAGDADINVNGFIDNNPDEYKDLRTESPALQTLYSQSPTKALYAINAIYSILRNTAGVKLHFSTVGNKTVATLTAVPTVVPEPNDTLVTIESGTAVGSLAPFVTNTRSFTGANGRNHSTIANAGVAQTVIPWIVSVEKASGDLK